MGTLVDHATSQYKADINNLADKYGDHSYIPVEEQRLLSERLRGTYVYELAVERGIKPAEAFKQYWIDSRVAEELLGAVPEVERDLTRAQRRTKVIAYCLDHPGEQLTTDQIAEVGGFSSNTARSLIEDRPDLFRKIGRGFYELRDPKTERAEKHAQPPQEEYP